MKVLGWIVGALVVLLALLALSGSELRLHGPPVVAKICDPPCPSPSWCDKQTGKCVSSASAADPTERPAPVCLPPFASPHSGALEIWLQQQRAGEPDPFEVAPAP